MGQLAREVLTPFLILDVVVVIMESASICLFLKLFLSMRFSRRFNQRLILFLLLLLLWQFLVYALIHSASTSVPIRAICVIAAYIAVALELFSGKWYKTVLFVFLFKMLSLVLEVCVGAFFVYVAADATFVVAKKSNLISYACAFTVRLAEFVIVFIIKGIKTRSPRKNQWRGLLFVPIISCVFLCIVYINYWEYNDQRINSLLFGLSAFLVVQNLFVFVYIALVQGSTERYLELEKAYDRQKQYFNAGRAIQQSVMKMAHDIRHHFIYLMNALESDDVPKARNYLITLDGNLKNLAPTRVTGNNDVDALLYAKAIPAIRQEIQISVEGKLPPDINIPPTDISIVIGNALDNAIQACSKVEHDREITVLFGFSNNRFSFTISNPFAGEIKKKPNGFLYSQKEGGGLGVEIMDQVVRKNDGYMNMSIDGQQYALSIMMQEKEASVAGLLAEETSY